MKDCKKCKSYLNCNWNQIGLGSGNWAKECPDFKEDEFNEFPISTYVPDVVLNEIVSSPEFVEGFTKEFELAVAEAAKKMKELSMALEFESLVDFACEIDEEVKTKKSKSWNKKHFYD